MSLIDNGITTSWRLGSWGATIGYPSCITFHEGRLCFAASPLEPQTLWMSVSGDYQNHAPTDTSSAVFDDSAINVTIQSGNVDAIKWLSSGPTLVIGTFNKEWQCRSSSVDGAPITPTNISILPQTTKGSNNIRPIRINSAILFVQRSGRKLYELTYDYRTDSLVAQDLTIVNDHIFRSGGKALFVAYQQEANSIYWVVLQDGRLAGLTYVRDQEVYAWHVHTIGGNFGGGDAVVESVASISNIDGTEDEVYVVVKRTIGGVTKRYIEYFSVEIDAANENDKDDFQFVDSCVPYSGAPVSSVPALNHITGETVQIFADGSVRPDSVVAGGAAPVSGGAASTIFAGLAYQSIFQSLPVEGGNPQGSSAGKTKRIDHVTLRLYQSMAFKCGPSEDNVTQFSARDTDAPMDSSAPLITDDVVLSFDGDYRRTGQVVIVRDTPTPLNILAMVPDFNTSPTGSSGS